jgi:YYY domain-containing protein
MISFILWTILLIVLGWAAFPILYALFPNLSDRGYGVAKPAGLLIFGYLYWILVTFRIIPNNWGGIASVFLLVILIGFLAARKFGWQSIKSWASENRWFVLFVEAAFILLFGFFAFMRAAYPEITGTEKPMELAFINSILRSDSFPPADPWLSGYGISYYYFGYVMVAGIIKLTNTISGVGFNLAVSLWFAIACLGAFSLAGNILKRISKPGSSREGKAPSKAGFGWALFAPFFLAFTANWEGLFEALHAKGIFWDANGQSAFWKWLDIEELTTAPSSPLGWLPSRPGGIWWWRASRVLQDFDLAGRSGGVIDEFPYFSLYLADLHPHILSMPFVLLACNLALEFFIKSRSGNQYKLGWYDFFKNWISNKSITTHEIDATLMPTGVFWSAALLFGGLAFLNIWDFPIYVGLATSAIVLGRYLSHGWNSDRIVEFLETGLGFGVAGAILYLPFYTGFASQAGGLLPSLAFFARGAHLWMMFGIFFVPILLGIVAVYGSNEIFRVIRFGLIKAISLVFILWIAMILLGLIFVSVPGLIGSLNPALGSTMSAAASQFFNVQGSALIQDVLGVTTLQRLASPGGWITLLILLALVWGSAIWLRENARETAIVTSTESHQPKTGSTINTLPFVFLLLAGGIGLVLFPEFFYLRDQFGTRMNTIFKFYFQAWILWSVAGAVFTYILWTWPHSIVRWGARIIFLISMFAGLMYPSFGYYFRFNDLHNRVLTLDGNEYFYTGYPDETAAISFLQQAPKGIVAEAIGGSYTAYGRVSTQSGLPTVLGWPGHESQWRGGAREIGSREPDIKLLYQTNDWQQALGIMQKYQIRYIYIGSLEKSTYRISEAKFQNNLRPVYQNNSVIIYEVPNQSLIPSPF